MQFTCDWKMSFTQWHTYTHNYLRLPGGKSCAWLTKNFVLVISVTKQQNQAGTLVCRSLQTSRFHYMSH